MKFILNITLFLLYSFISYSQSFKGVVMDSETKQPLKGVEVYFPDLRTSTLTDKQGKFHISHYEQKEIQIQLGKTGYESLNLYLDFKRDNHAKIYLVAFNYRLDEVLVSKFTGKLEYENTMPIEHKSISELAVLAPITLGEAINNISGIETINTGIAIGKPVIRGLSGNRIVTYSQGIRVENQQWGDEHGIGVGQLGIESVEVIKGPASVLYGSDAISGVLYFVDERYAIHDQAQGFAQSRVNSATMGITSSLGYKIHKGVLKLNVFGGYTSHADYNTPKFGNVYNTRFDEKNFKASFGFNIKNWISDVRYSYLQNNFGVVEDAIYNANNARVFKIPYQSVGNHILSFENVLFIGSSKLNLNFGYTFNNRREFDEHHNEEDHDIDDSALEDFDDENHTDHSMGLNLSTYTYNLNWKSKKYFNLFDLVLGSQGMHQINDNTGEEVLIPNAVTIDVGMFGVVNFDFDEVKFQLGGRADSRHIQTEYMVTEENQFSAFRKMVYGVSVLGGFSYELDKVQLKANISGGFRAPNTSELLSNGSHGGTNRYEIGNRGLTSEIALQMDFMVSYKSEYLDFKINPFISKVENYIYLAPTGEVIENDPVFQYKQKLAILHGGEAGVHFHPQKVHWLHIESDVSTVFARDKNEEPIPLIPQTKLNTLVRAEFTNKGGVRMKSVSAQYIYKFDQNIVATDETISPAYGVTNIGINLEAFNEEKPLDIEVGVKNIFNQEYIDHLSRFKTLGIPDVGINFYFGLKYSFDHKL